MTSSGITDAELADRFTSLDLEQFFNAVRSVVATPAACEPINAQQMADFFAVAGKLIDEAENREREINRIEARAFNVFALIEPDENKISDILADFLDPRGQHGQRDRFLRLLVEKLRPGSNFLGLDSARVSREAPTHGIQKYRRRIDILVVSTGIVIAIENKIDALEQSDQVKDYLDHLAVLSNGWTMPAFLIYLTPNGREPESLSALDRAEQKNKGRLYCLSYSTDLRGWLESCEAQCQAPKIRFFIADFISYINTVLKRAPQPESSEEPQ